jgi:hypothetical protein
MELRAAVTPSPISGLRLALRLHRLVGAVWLVSMAVFLPAHLVAELAAGATRAGLPDRPLPPGDSLLMLVELFRPVAGPFALALVFGGLAFLAWSVLWHGGVARWWLGLGNGTLPVPLAEILGHGIVWWWRYVRLAVVAVTVTAALLAAIWVPLRPLIRTVGTTGDGGRSGVLLVAGLGLTGVVLVMWWLATLRGAWLLGEPGRRSAMVAWLRGFVATLRQPIRSLWTLVLWAVPGFALLVLPVLIEGSAAWLALLPAWLGSAFCWVALFLSFAPPRLPTKQTASPLDPPTFVTAHLPTQPPEVSHQ